MREYPVLDRAAAAVNRREQHGAVQGKLQGFSDPQVVKRGDALIERNIGDADTRNLEQPLLIDVPVQKELCRIPDFIQVKHVDLSAFKHSADLFGVCYEAKIEPFTAGGALPTGGVCHQKVADTRHPLFQNKGACSDHPICVRPEAVTGLLCCLLIQNGRARHRQAGKEGRIGLFERDRKTKIVQHLEARQILCLSAFQGLRPQNAICNITVAGIWVGQKPDKGILHVRGRQS